MGSRKTKGTTVYYPLRVVIDTIALDKGITTSDFVRLSIMDYIQENRHLLKDRNLIEACRSIRLEKEKMDKEIETKFKEKIKREKSISTMIPVVLDYLLRIICNKKRVNIRRAVREAVLNRLEEEKEEAPLSKDFIDYWIDFERRNREKETIIYKHYKTKEGVIEP